MHSQGLDFFVKFDLTLWLQRVSDFDKHLLLKRDQFCGYTPSITCLIVEAQNLPARFQILPYLFAGFSPWEFGLFPSKGHKCVYDHTEDSRLSFWSLQQSWWRWCCIACRSGSESTKFSDHSQPDLIIHITMLLANNMVAPSFSFIKILYRLNRKFITGITQESTLYGDL